MCLKSIFGFHQGTKTIIHHLFSDSGTWRSIMYSEIINVRGLQLDLLKSLMIPYLEKKHSKYSIQYRKLLFPFLQPSNNTSPRRDSDVQRGIKVSIL